MKRLLVANAKGVTGKTTLATNLAGLLAARGVRTVLVDLDRQCSAVRWLERRPAGFPKIAGWTPDDERDEVEAFDPQWAVYDSPAGLHGKKLDRALKRVDLIVVPLSPSVLDMDATVDFLETLAEFKAVRKGESAVALVANRVDPRTLSALELENFLAAYDLPVIAHLHAAQVYVQCAAAGATLFDLPPSRAEPEIGQWAPIRDWIAKHLR
jgi:chromosome partitioning protein